mmetsp:Transcript_5469/g.16307  ORF Transcript_5469/g.16307 Transcript_5469/m.16307 type:complete len:257 (+) Transcript_5469:178-948(+)
MPFSQDDCAQPAGYGSHDNFFDDTVDFAIFHDNVEEQDLLRATTPEVVPENEGLANTAEMAWIPLEDGCDKFFEQALRPEFKSESTISSTVSTETDDSILLDADEADLFQTLGDVRKLAALPDSSPISQHNNVKSDLDVNSSSHLPRQQSQTFGNCNIEQLSDYFHLPRAEAASRLRISVTLLKRRCRKAGIQRWPYRKIRALQERLSKIQVIVMDETSPALRVKLEQERSYLTLLVKQLKQRPNNPLPLSLPTAY